jgi:hypothetical protein
MGELERNLPLDEQKNQSASHHRSVAMVMLSAPPESESSDNGKSWKLSVIGQVLSGNIPLDSMVPYLEQEIAKNAVLWMAQSTLTECRKKFQGLLRSVVGDKPSGILKEFYMFTLMYFDHSRSHR